MGRIAVFVSLLAIWGLLPVWSAAQETSIHLHAESPEYDKDLLPAEFHTERRTELRKLMPDSSMAIFFASPVRNRSNDVNYEYHQDPDFYYFTGLREPHSALLIFKEEQEVDGQLTNEVLFVQPNDPGDEVWNGKRYGVSGAISLLKVKRVMQNNQLADFKIPAGAVDKIFYHEIPQDVRDDKEDRGDLASMLAHFERKSNAIENSVDPRYLADMTAVLRQDKQIEELTLMRKAIDITCEAQKAVMQKLDSNMAEYQVEALVEYHFKDLGAEYPGFPSIIGSGENSCILHYVSNRRPMLKNDMLVVDIGAEYRGYTADVTRTLPVNGKYSKEQLAIYNLVLTAQEAGIKACKPGADFRAPHNAVWQVISKGLVKLGITETVRQTNDYFLHGTSHYLGLDVHDAGLYGPLQANEVITVEPGIYISADSKCDPKWWNIGVRIEDDVLITPGGYEVLSDCIPKKPKAVEALMNAN